MKKLSLFVLVFWCLSWALVPIGYSSGTYTMTEAELQQLQTNLDKLKQNNETLLNLLDESGMDLTTASTELASSKTQIETLKTQLQQSANQITELKAQLTQLKQENQNTVESLKKINDSLQQASNNFKAYQKEQSQIQSDLRLQCTLWKIVAAIGVGYGIHK